MISFHKTRISLLSCCLLLVMLSTPGISQSANAYIAGQIPAPIREGQSSDSTVIHPGLPSGTQINILALSEDQKWSLIRTSDGIKGWIPAQSVQKNPPTQQAQQKALSNLAYLKNEVQSTATDSANKPPEDTVKQYKKLQQNYDNAVTELDRLKKLSTEAIRLDQANSELLKTNQLIKIDMERLTAEIDSLKADNFTKGLQYGAGILTVGFLIGYSIKSRNSRRDRW